MPPQRVVGAQYVVGSPPATPVLRPLKNPLYDTEVYPAAGVGRLQFFTNAQTIAATGAAKTLADTNMTQNGQLGTPLEFDLVGFNSEIAKGVPVADFNGIFNTGVWQWIFGNNTPWLTVPVTRIPEGLQTTGAATTTVAATTITLLSQGVPHVSNFYNFSVDRKARHIFSQESFRGELTYPIAVVPITANARIRFYAQGVLFSQL